MNVLHRKPGLPRIEPTQRPEMSDDNAHLWSVSYADLLMVLLSFFILFFSVDKDRRISIISKILQTDALGSLSTAMSGEVGGPSPMVPVATSANPIPKDGGSYQAPTAPLGLKDTLSSLGVTSAQENDQLLLMFPENIFKTNEAVLSPEQEKGLRAIVQRLIPFKEKIDLTFIGSTDATPISKKTDRIQNNFDLSALRASRAMMIAAEAGFPISGLRMKGSANYERSSRTLSIQISTKGTPL